MNRSSIVPSSTEVVADRRPLLRIASLAILVASLPSGCSMYKAAARNIINEPIAQADKCLFNARNRIAAEEAWEVVSSGEPPCTYSSDYADGFIDGFENYLKDGGPPTPPAQPPKRYWRVRYENPAGKRAVEDWYAGFRRGAETASQTPFRDYVLVRTYGVLPRSQDTYTRIADVDYPPKEADAASRTVPPMPTADVYVSPAPPPLPMPARVR